MLPRARTRREAPRYGLRSVLLLFLLPPILLVATAAGWYSLRSLERQIEARMQEDIELIARALRLPVSHAMERGREGSVAQALDSAFRIGRVYGVYVYDAEGERVAASGPESPSVETEQAARLASLEERKGTFDSVAGEEVFSYFVPLTDSGGRVNGLLQLTRRGSDFRDYVSGVRRQALALLVVTALALATVVVYGHHRAVGRPVRRLRAGMARVGAGERDHRLPVEGPRELGELADGVNGMLDSLGQQEALLARQRDERAALEARLAQSEKMAAIGRLAAGVAHELGTPLNVVDGNAQRALRREDLPGPAAAALREIRTEVQRVGSIVRQLMDFGRSNPLSVEPERADRLVRSVLARVSDEARRTRRVEIASGGPPPKLAVDRLRLEQALANLVENALHASRERVRIGWFETSERAGFAIEDDGPGISDEDRARIFEPFYTTKPVNRGTGLGLAVAHAAVRDHEGSIEVGSSELGGACLRIVLPRAAEHRNG